MSFIPGRQVGGITICGLTALIGGAYERMQNNFFAGVTTDGQFQFSSICSSRRRQQGHDIYTIYRS